MSAMYTGTVNLNALLPEDRDNTGYQRATTVTAVDGSVVAYFDNLQDRLIEHIRSSDAVFGAVAWLTSGAILDALAECGCVAIVVQKEDFLRPDISSKSNWTGWLRQKYEALTNDLTRFEVSSKLLPSLDTGSGETIEPIRCVGNVNREKASAFPRSHHKFVVFCRFETEIVESLEDWEWDEQSDTYIHLPKPRTVLKPWTQAVPYAVWTGSFNFTENGTKSLENAVVIYDPNIVRGYMEEFAHVYSLSEALDWNSEWVAPEHRIGT